MQGLHQSPQAASDPLAADQQTAPVEPPAEAFDPEAATFEPAGVATHTVNTGFLFQGEEERGGSGAVPEFEFESGSAGLFSLEGGGQEGGVDDGEHGLEGLDDDGRVGGGVVPECFLPQDLPTWAEYAPEEGAIGTAWTELVTLDEAVSADTCALAPLCKLVRTVEERQHQASCSCLFEFRCFPMALPHTSEVDCARWGQAMRFHMTLFPLLLLLWVVCRSCPKQGVSRQGLCSGRVTGTSLRSRQC